jgi:hypothetical protein
VRTAGGKLVIFVAALFAALASVWQLERTRAGVSITELAVGTTPATVYRTGQAPAPLVVVAHGFAGSTQLMQAFSLTLARAGYVVVAFDFEGHGRNPVPMSGDVTTVDGTTRLLVEETRRVIDAGLALPGTDGRVALLGHSMASDVVVRTAVADPRVDAVVAVSMFSEAVSAEEPRQLLAITGEWEGFLRQAALDAARLVDPGAREGETVRERRGRPAGRRGGARRACRRALRPHLADGSAGLARPELREGGTGRARPRRTVAGAADGEPRGAGLAAFHPHPRQPASAAADHDPRLRPGAGGSRTRRPAGRDAGRDEGSPRPRGGLPRVPPRASGKPADPPAAPGRRALRPASPPGRRGALVWGLGVFGLALDRYGANFMPIPERIAIIAALALGTVPYMAADALATIGTAASLLRRLAARAALLGSLSLAVALDFERLFFLAIILPVILLFFLVFGLMGRWVGLRAGATPVGLALGVILAWSLGVSFPLFTAG